MALNLKFATYQVSRNCDCFFFYDTTGDYNADTNPGGWGAPNAEKADMVAFTVKILTADGQVFNATYQTSLVPIPTIDSPLAICSTNFTKTGTEAVPTTLCDVCPQGSGSGFATIGTYTGTTNDILSKMADGCVELTYEVLTLDGYSCEACDYAAAITTAYSPINGINYSIWANVNGVLLNYTSRFQYNSVDETYDYSIEATCDVLTAWQVRKGTLTVLQTGSFTQSNCETITVDPIIPTVYASASHNTTFVCSTQDRYNELVLRIETMDCVNCNPTDNETACDLMKVGALLTAAVNGSCNCDCTNKQIAIAGNILSAIENECP